MGLLRGHYESVIAVVFCLASVCDQVVVCVAVNSAPHRFDYDNPSDSLSERRIEIKMPGTRPLEKDTYLCTAVQLLPQEEYIVEFEPSASQDRVHHMLLFGCSYPGSSSHSWDCKSGPYMPCLSSQEIIYAWAKDAPAKYLPKDVGFAVGGDSIKYLVLQVHYASVVKEGEKDYSGFILHTRRESLPYLAGIYLLWAYKGSIPPESSGVHVDVACRYKKSEPMYAFAFRTHAHKLAKVITGYRIRHGVWTLLGKGDPQAPQAFYPMKATVDIRKGDILAARCTYESKGHDIHGAVHMGSSGDDEMCNFYIMYFSNAEHLEYAGGDCGEQNHPTIFKNFPPESDMLPVSIPTASTAVPTPTEMPMGASTLSVTPTIKAHEESITDSQAAIPVIPALNVPSEPVNPVTQARKTEQQYPELHVISDWPNLTALKKSKLGQVTGVSVDSKGQVVVFHRGTRIWDDSTFDSSNVFRNADMVGTISEHTVWIIDSVTGKVKGFWGKDLFYLPHGLTIDHRDNLWVTDVGSHQVFKFSPLSDRTQRLLSIGDKLVPGSGNSRFCKPTSVAVDENGEFFVADGYCNSRIMKFSSAGKLLNIWGKPSSGPDIPALGAFLIPHSLALDSAGHRLFIADRENGRVQVMNSKSGAFNDEIKLPEFGGLVYAVDYSENEQGGVLHVVNGPNSVDYNRKKKLLVQGFTIRVADKALIQTWPSSKRQFLSRPHDLVSSADGTDVYVVEIGPNRVWKLSSKQQTTVSTPMYSVPAITNELLGVSEGSGLNPKQARGKGNTSDTKTSKHRGSIRVKVVEEKAKLIPLDRQESVRPGDGDGGQISNITTADANAEESSGPQEGRGGEKSSVNLGHQDSTGQGDAGVDSNRETSSEHRPDHQDSDSQGHVVSSSSQKPSLHNSTTGTEKVHSSVHTSEPTVVWVKVTQKANFRPAEPATSGASKKGPKNDALDSDDEVDDSENITEGVIPALVVLSVLAVPIVFLLLISIVIRIRAFRRDRNQQVNGFHASKSDLSVGRTRGWWSYMNCCDRQRYRFNRVTLTDFYSDSDSDGV